MLQRITIIKKKPKRRKAPAAKPYWIPIVLWSVEKKYFFHQGRT
jgi:hypothetical protein